MNRKPNGPTSVRLLIVGVTTLSAVLLYLDRFCISFAERFIKEDLNLTDDQMGWILSAFFWAYAVGQVPSGWLGDRFGARRMLAAYIVLWSAFTGLTGMAVGIVSLLACRSAIGLAQAGAYPVSASLLSRWIPFTSRGLASSVVAFGGRLGGWVAPVLTAYLIVAAGWRASMMIYGVGGVAVAILFWVSFRDRPDQHPWCGPEEIAIIEAGRPAGSLRPQGAVGGIPWTALLSSPSLWLNCVMQWGTNVGWAFLVTWLPRYLMEVHDVPTVTRGWMTSVPILVGGLGLLCGGWLTDRLVSMIGLRWGRSLPMVGSRLVAMAAFLVCLLPMPTWGVVIVFSVVALATDLGIGAVWAFQQDVGGRHVGSVLGWGNMWGNFGAAVSPPLLNWIVKRAGWDAAFLACAAAFLIAALSSLGIDATKSIEVQDPHEPGVPPSP